MVTIIKKELVLICVLVLVVTGGLLTSCQTAPKVVAKLSESLPARSADSVMVFRTTDSVPASARKIGTVKVKDGGLTPTKDCLFPNMLALAVKKTAESGGNGFHIDEHRYPGFHGSTCHRVLGTMYLIADSLITTDTRSVLHDLEMYEEDVAQAKASQMITNKRDRRLANPSDVLKINAGPSWIVSELVTPYSIYKSKLGISLGADYQHIWRSGLGIGVNFMYFGTSFDEGFSMRMFYLGPSIVGSLMVGQKWRWDASLGLGFSHYMEELDGGRYYSYYDTNTSYSENRLGAMFQTGLEYMLSRNVSIGLQITLTTVSLKKPEGYDDKYDFYGIRRIDPQIGIRCYL